MLHHITPNRWMMLLRIFFFFVAVFLSFQIWKGYEFALAYPFIIQTLFDAFFVVILLFLAAKLPFLIQKHPYVLVGIITLWWLYTIASNAINIGGYAHALGVKTASEFAGLSPVLYVLYESASALIVPTLLYIAVLVTVQKARRASA